MKTFPKSAEITRMFFLPPEEEPPALRDRANDILETLLERFRKLSPTVDENIQNFSQLIQPYFDEAMDIPSLCGTVFQIMVIGYELKDFSRELAMNIIDNLVLLDVIQAKLIDEPILIMFVEEVLEYGSEIQKEP